MIFDLPGLLAPMSMAEFLDAFRAGRRLHVRTSTPGRLEALLPWPDVESLLDILARGDKLIVMRDGNTVSKQFYTSGPDQRFSTQAFHALAAQGVSVLMAGIGGSAPRIGHLEAAIERELGIRTMVNAYLSISKGGAFKPHRDAHDVLIAQIHGHKQWKVWNADVPYLVDEMAEPKIADGVPPDQVIDLAPGDIFFIPRGEPHSAAVSSGSSLHLTIGLKHAIGLDFIDYLRKHAVDDPLLRMNLPRHSSAGAAMAHETAVKQALHRLIDSTGVAQFFREDDLQRRPYLHTAVSGVLPQPDDLLSLTLRRRIALPDVAGNGAPQPVTIGGEVCLLAPASIDALQWLFDHGPARQRALHDAMVPRYGRPSTEAALRELLRHGLVAVNAAR